MAVLRVQVHHGWSANRGDRYEGRGTEEWGTGGWGVLYIGVGALAAVGAVGAAGAVGAVGAVGTVGACGGIWGLPKM